jgi:hypothetical protein
VDEAEGRIFARILKSLEAHLLECGGGCRIVALCRPEFAVSLAEHLQQGVVILLPLQASGFAAAPRPAVPNLDFLTCGLSSAHFVPRSVSAVVALGQDAETWECQQNLQIVADWLQPGGILCLDMKPGPLWKEWSWRLTGSESDLISLASSVGLQREESQMPRLQIWRRI